MAVLSPYYLWSCNFPFIGVTHPSQGKKPGFRDACLAKRKSISRSGGGCCKPDPHAMGDIGSPTALTAPCRAHSPAAAPLPCQQKNPLALGWRLLQARSPRHDRAATTNTFVAVCRGGPPRPPVYLPPRGRCRVKRGGGSLVDSDGNGSTPSTADAVPLPPRGR